ncbi:hypothetical protein NC652_031985 [Populus alba x Populus x berolinensis]|nr:hypothetical protein NC652_031985 [Populus alba x Populus x berolinensis]
MAIWIFLSQLSGKLVLSKIEIHKHHQVISLLLECMLPIKKSPEVRSFRKLNNQPWWIGRSLTLIWLFN